MPTHTWFRRPLIVDGGTAAGANQVESLTVVGTLTLTGATITGAPTWGSNQAITLSTAAQPNVTSLGTLTALQVDNINIDGNTISSTAGVDLLITPLAGQQLVLDGTIVIDAGVVTGATSITSTVFVGALTGNASTATALQTARTIGGVSFDGTADITVASATGGFTVTGNVLVTGNGAMTISGTSALPLDLTQTGAGEIDFRIQRTGGTATDWRLYLPAGSSDLRFYNGADRITFSAAGAVTVGALTTNGGLQTFGANDTGGAGFRLVLVPNA